jgi:diaminopimelate epimerase
MSTRIAFLKGHGTENDFVIVPDPENTIDLSPAAVAALCDRRAGIGGDGVLHVVRSAAHPEARHMAAEAEWFMDYRNGDGSIAEMCGNGTRVFARYLQRAGHVTEGDFAIATRGGVKPMHIAKDGDVTTGMGTARLPEGDVTVSVGGRDWPARNVNMGNPHAVAFVDDLAHAGDLLSPPPFSPAAAYPDGVNVEFVVDRGPGHVAMRVHERGAGETRSCGTGACAAAWAALDAVGRDAGTVVVDVPGGRLSVRVDPTTTVLTGPAVLVAAGTLTGEWLAGRPSGAA